MTCEGCAALHRYYKQKIEQDGRLIADLERRRFEQEEIAARANRTAQNWQDSYEQLKAARDRPRARKKKG